MSSAPLELTLCICGQLPTAPVHSQPSGHKYTADRWLGAGRDDQSIDRGRRPGHYTVSDYRVISIPAPAPGVDVVAVVPTPSQWRVQCLQAQLITSAVIANRVPHLIIKDQLGNYVYNFPAPTNQVASSTMQYSAGTTTVAAQFDNASVLVLPFPVKLLQGWSVGFLTTALQAADQWSNAALYVKEWLEF